MGTIYEASSQSTRKNHHALTQAILTLTSIIGAQYSWNSATISGEHSRAYPFYSLIKQDIPLPLSNEARIN